MRVQRSGEGVLGSCCQPTSACRGQETAWRRECCWEQVGPHSAAGWAAWSATALLAACWPQARVTSVQPPMALVKETKQHNKKLHALKLQSLPW